MFSRLAALPEALQPLARPFYLVAILLIGIPALDFYATVAPPQWSEVRWRFGMLGILGGYLLTPLFGSVLTMAMAAMMEHRRMQLAMMFVNAFIGIVIVAALGLHALDAVQIRGEIGTESIQAFDFVALRTAAKLAIGAFTFFWLSRASLKSYRKVKLPEGWQPGDPVPIVNRDTANVEGLPVEGPAVAERVSREMLIGPDAVNVEAAPPARGSGALRREMLLTPSSIPAIDSSAARRSDGVRPDMLVNTESVRVDNPPSVEPKRVTKDMLIVGGEEPDGK